MFTSCKCELLSVLRFALLQGVFILKFTLLKTGAELIAKCLTSTALCAVN